MPAIPAAVNPRVDQSTSTPFERSLTRLADWLDGLQTLARNSGRPAAADLAALNSLLADVWIAGGDGLRPGLPRGSAAQRRFRQQVGPALWESSCMHHAAVKPRGHQGDFQLMQRVYDNVPAGVTPRGRWLDAWLLGLPYARAVRNRGAMMVGLLAKIWLDGGRRIGDVACGAAPELAAVHRFLPFRSITLFDQDSGALQAAADAIGATHLYAHQHPVRSIIDGRVHLETGLDLVYATGLYDYLSTGTATALTERLWTALAPGGSLVVGNFADGDHADQHLLEAALDWYLRYRTPAEMLALVDGLPGLATAQVRTDPTGSLHMLVARRADAVRTV
jgi:hypothetical protein